MKYVYSEKTYTYGVVFNRGKDFLLTEGGAVWLMSKVGMYFVETDKVPEEIKEKFLAMIDLAYCKADLMLFNEKDKIKIKRLRKKADIIFASTIRNEASIEVLNNQLKAIARLYQPS